MPQITRKLWWVSCLLMAILAGSLPSSAATDHPTDGAGERLTLLFGPYMLHFNPQSDHNDIPWFIALEWSSPAGWEAGGAWFQNSYDQPSAYLYGGRRWNRAAGEGQLFLSLTAGALLGYVKPHDDRIPVNWNGFGLGIIPAFGYQYQRASVQFATLGISGVLFLVSYDLWP